MRLPATRLARVRRSLLAVAMVLAWSRLFDLGPPRAGAAAPAAVDAAVTERARQAERLRRLLKVAAVADRSIVGRMLDPAPIATAAGLDPGKLCAWVSDNTCWVPYHGVLRGSAGVLLDRLGNAADRAVLLADLLRAAGFETRLARATLPDAVATAQLAKVHRVPDDWRPPTFDGPEGGDPAIAEAMRQFGVDPAALQRRQAAAEVRSDQLVEAIVGRSAEQAPAVAALAWPAGAAPAGVTAAPGGTGERDALADHWWVEYRKHADDAWAGLDPTCGVPPVAAAATTVTRAGDGRFALPPGSAHEVEVRVVREQWLGGALRQDVVLRQALRPKDVIGQPVMVVHQPIGWPVPLDVSREPDPAAKLRQLLAAPREWVPQLIVGSDTVTQAGVNADGSIDPKPVLDELAQAGATAGKGAAAAADLLDTREAPPAPAAPAGVLTAEWVEYEIRTPGRDHPQVVRRELFDSIGPAARAAGVTAMPVLTESQRVEQGLGRMAMTDIALQPCAIPAAYVQHLSLRALADNAAGLSDLVDAPPVDAKGADAAIGKLNPAPVALYALASGRFAASPVAGSVYLDHPNVLARHLQLRLTAQRPAADGTGPFAELVGFDVVENGVAVHARPGVVPARVRLQQGVVDTVAESVLLDPGGARTDNASDLFATDAGRGQAWTTLGPGEADRLASMPLPADAKARMADDLRAGHLVIVAAGAPGPGGLAWWSVDRATGQTLGIGSNGWGAAMTERAFLTRLAFKMIAFIVCLGGALGGTTGADKTIGLVVFCSLALAFSIAGLAASGSEAAGIIGDAGDLLSIIAAGYSNWKK